MNFEELWARLPIPGEFDAMDECDQNRWRSAVQSAAEIACYAERERCIRLFDNNPTPGKDCKEWAQAVIAGEDDA